MKCDPSYATGGKGSEVTLVFDAGARSSEMMEDLEKVKFGHDALQ